MRKGLLRFAAMSLGVFAASNASAATLAACSVNDITPTALACAGFEEKNLLNNANLDEQRAALASLGLTDWNGVFVEKINLVDSAKTVDFGTLLTGVTYFGIHFGNGKGGPGNGTAFYKLDAGAGLDKIGLVYNASSSAALYRTGVAAVPEPATWAMMLLGFGTVGYTMRRRKAVDLSYAV